MKRIATITSALVVAFVLAACTVEPAPPPTPPANTIDLVATNDFANALTEVTVAPGRSQVFHVEVPASVRNSDLLYIELDRAMPLEVMTGAYGTVTESSASSEFFGRGASGLELASTSTDLDTQAIGITVPCRGACVILDDAPSDFYMRVSHGGGSAPSTFNVFVFGDVHADLGEDLNDNLTDAPPMQAIDGGAIETIDDIDFFWMDTTTIVEFNTTTGGLAVEAHRLNSAGQEIGGPYTGGQSFGVNVGDFVRVWAVNPDRAAASARSEYSFTY